MKILISISFLFSSLFLYCQNSEDVLLKATTGNEIKCKIIAYEKPSIRIQKENGNTAIIHEDLIESINGKPFAEYIQSLNELPLKDGKLHYENVVEIEETKSNLYTKARIWFSDNFKSADDVIQMDDKEAGIIMGKGYSDIYVDYRSLGVINKLKTRAFYTVKIQLKENKYKIDIYDVYYYSYPTPSSYTKTLGYISGYPSVKSYPEDLFLFDKSSLDDLNNNQKEKMEITVESYKNETIALINRLASSIRHDLSKKLEIEDF